MSDSPILDAMQAYDWPLTRETWLEIEFMGDVPAELPAELEIPNLPYASDVVHGHALGVLVDDNSDGWQDADD